MSAQHHRKFIFYALTYLTANGILNYPVLRWDIIVVYLSTVRQKIKAYLQLTQASANSGLYGIIEIERMVKEMLQRRHTRKRQPKAMKKKLLNLSLNIHQSKFVNEASWSWLYMLDFSVRSLTEYGAKLETPLSSSRKRGY